MAQIHEAIWLQEDPRRLVILYFFNWQVILNNELLFTSTSHHQVDGFFLPLRKKQHFFPLHSRTGCLKCTQKFKLDLSVNQ